ncbi:laminin-like protein lam-2 [Paramacrobiotus metropolitanus]|uniref:laminin-like protein lam-2 n=1 Tax=Paramacrobiotus metropolitanus TaxID=2943436 RepID=UPI002445ECC5|nr:laminin-like protein lam-2 [Paramacrobiotus metropolitanus]
MPHCKAWICLTWLVYLFLLETKFTTAPPSSSDDSQCPYGSFMNGTYGCVNCACYRRGTTDPYGSSTQTCDANTGQCQCGRNIIERTCDRCNPGSYDLSAGYCLDCWCALEGSSSTVCNEVTGQCKCKNDNIGGRGCERCRVGFCNYPVCEPCENIIGPAIAKIPTTIVNATLDILRAFSFYIRPY